MSNPTTDPCPPPEQQCAPLVHLATEVVELRQTMQELAPKVQRAIEVCTVLEARYSFLRAQGEDTVAATVTAMRKAAEAKSEVQELARESGKAAASELVRVQRKLYLAAAAVLVALATAIPALVQHYTGQTQAAVPAASK